MQRTPYRFIKFLFVLIILNSFFVAAAWATSIQMTGVRLSKQSDLTRFVFDLSGPAHYHFSAADKQRLLLTVKNTVLVVPLPTTGLSKTPVQDYQASSQPDQSLQLVFNVNQSVIPKAYTLPPAGAHGYRLVLDLKSTSNANSQDSASSAEKTTVKSIKAKNNRPALVIVIDPGHGGKDPGATGAAGSKEKNVVLAISKILSKQLSQESQFRVYLTRSHDEFISLRQRLAIARRFKADLFIAIHADAAYANTANGASVFALSERGATSEMARWLAAKENKSELVDGVFVNKDQILRSVLLDLSQTHTISVSLEIGEAILRQLGACTGLHYARVEQAAFVVLKSPDIPSLLVETGYLSNPAQEQQLTTPAYQQKIANAIVAGIKDYFARHPPQAV